MNVTLRRPLLIPLVPLYVAGVALRNWFFDRGIFRSTDVGVPVISIGNIDAGGTGKTPLVELIVRKLASKGRKVAIVSRGYRRATKGLLVVNDGSPVAVQSSAVGDEPAQMASKLQGVTVVVDEDRVRGAHHAVSKLHADVVVLDDGFQHRALRRAVDIVLIPADKAIEPEWSLPAGNRREPIGSLQRATMVALSRCDNRDHFLAAKRAIATRTQKPIIGLSTRISAVRRATTKFSIDISGLRGKTVVAFSGIGTPEAFGRTLQSLGIELKAHTVFPDHHDYSESDLHSIAGLVAKHAADYVLTTEKDVMRLSSGGGHEGGFIEKTPLFYVEIEQQVIEGEAELNSVLDMI